MSVSICATPESTTLTAIWFISSDILYVTTLVLIIMMMFVVIYLKEVIANLILEPDFKLLQYRRNNKWKKQKLNTLNKAELIPYLFGVV